jgi:hypothetical protein
MKLTFINRLRLCFEILTVPVVCPHCGAEYADFTHEAEFIGWNGVCAKCVLVDGVEI